MKDTWSPKWKMTSASVATCVIGMVREAIHRYVVRGDGPFDADAVASGLVRFAVDGLTP